MWSRLVGVSSVCQLLLEKPTAIFQKSDESCIRSKYLRSTTPKNESYIEKVSLKAKTTTTTTTTYINNRYYYYYQLLPTTTNYNRVAETAALQQISTNIVQLNRPVYDWTGQHRGRPIQFQSCPASTPTTLHMCGGSNSRRRRRSSSKQPLKTNNKAKRPCRSRKIAKNNKVRLF